MSSALLYVIQNASVSTTGGPIVDEIASWRGKEYRRRRRCVLKNDTRNG
jgi:hypothetical protein